jgi:hypothetical protein
MAEPNVSRCMSLSTGTPMPAIMIQNQMAKFMAMEKCNKPRATTF